MASLVLAPIDGSPLAEHALPWAAELARRTGAGLRLVRAHLPPVSVAAEGFVAMLPGAEDAARREGEADYFRRTVERVTAAHPDVAVSSELIDVDLGADVADTLAEYAFDRKADFAVLTTHGRGPFTRFWLGSTADEFVRHASVPTLLLRPDGDAPADLAARPALRHVLVPLDGSELGEGVIDPAARLAALFGADVTLMLVLAGGTPSAPLPGLAPAGLPETWDPPPAAERAAHYLDRVADRVRGRGLTVSTVLDRHESAAAGIIEHEKTHPDTLVALATHGRGGLTRLLLGSTSDKVIRGAHGPVLVFRPA